jgi:hypothetical protein
MPIRKGDGTNVNPKGIAEIRKGDTTVVFSAGPSLPSDGTYYDFENEQADSGLPDNWESINAPSVQGVDDGNSKSGSQSYNAYGKEPIPTTRPAVQPYNTYFTDLKASLWAFQQNTGANRNESGISLREDNTEIIRVSMYNGNLSNYDGSNYNVLSTTPNSDEWVRIIIKSVYPSTNTFDLKWETSNESGEINNINSMSSFSDGWNSVAAVFYGEYPGTYVDAYEIFK